MQLKAITLGYVVPQGGFEARVHSSFHSAVNLKMDDDPYLLTLVPGTETDLPQGIRVDSPPDFTFKDLPINERVRCQDGILQFARSRLSIDLTQALRWKSDLDANGIGSTDPKFSSAWTKVWKLLNDQQKISEVEIMAENLLHPQDGKSTELIQHLVKGVTALISSTEKNDFDTSLAVSTLIGLGSGLTPSGDDLLVGYLAGLFCLSAGNETRKKYISELGKTIIKLSKNTTDISRTYLYHAANGQFSKNLTCLANAICSGESSDQLVSFAIAAMNMGHSSGLDSVTGLLLGLKAWDGYRQ